MKILIFTVAFLLSAVCLRTTALAEEIGINKLQSSITGQIDAKLHSYDTGCYASSLGVVYGSNIVYTKSYGSDHLTSVHEWALSPSP